MGERRKAAAWGLLALSLSIAPAAAQATDINNLSLEQLANLEITRRQIVRTFSGPAWAWK